MTTEIQGFYGTNNPCTILIYNRGITSWYCVEGSRNVNCCYENELQEGVNVEGINDLDTFRADVDVDGLEVLEVEVDDYLNG